MKRPLRRNRNVFRFKDLPRELRNHIYADAIDHTTPSEFPVSHRFNSNLPLVDRQVNREASSIMFAIPDLVFRIDGYDALSNLPAKLKRAEIVPSFKKCRLDFYVIRWGLLDGKFDSGLPALACLTNGDFRKALASVAEQLTAMPHLEELEIGYFSTLPRTGTEYKFWPDDLVDSFGVLNGFREVTVKGDFEGDLRRSYVKQLKSMMIEPTRAEKNRRCESMDQKSHDRVDGNSISTPVMYLIDKQVS